MLQCTVCIACKPASLAALCRARCAAGQPGLPRNVEIQAGVSTLSVIWDAPAVSDTASSYTVMIYSDAGDSTFTPAKLAGTWSGIPWNSNSEDPQQTYYYSLPTPTGLTNGKPLWPRSVCDNSAGVAGSIVLPASLYACLPASLHSLHLLPCMAHSMLHCAVWCAGYYRAAVEAVNTATDRSSANSGIDRAALGDPGQITIDSVK